MGVFGLCEVHWSLFTSSSCAVSEQEIHFLREKALQDRIQICAERAICPEGRLNTASEEIRAKSSGCSLLTAQKDLSVQSMQAQELIHSVHERNTDVSRTFWS